VPTRPAGTHLGGTTAECERLTETCKREVVAAEQAVS